MSRTPCMPIVDKVKGEGKMEKQKEQWQPQSKCFLIPEIIPCFMTHPACPRETLEQSQGTIECIISTLLMQSASHKGQAPPAAKGFLLKHKYGSELPADGIHTKPRRLLRTLWSGHWGRFQAERAQASQLNGSGFESHLHYLLTVGPRPRPQRLGFLI